MYQTHETKQFHSARLMGIFYPDDNEGWRNLFDKFSEDVRKVLIIPQKSRGIHRQADESWYCRPDYSFFWKWLIVVSSKVFAVLIHRRSTRAFPGRPREIREVPANKGNVRNLHKTEHLKGTKNFVHWIITSDRNCFSFKHKARTYVNKDRSHEITACFGSEYLHWWMVGKKFSRILGRMEYFLSRMWRRWRWLIENTLRRLQDMLVMSSSLALLLTEGNLFQVEKYILRENISLSVVTDKCQHIVCVNWIVSFTLTVLLKAANYVFCIFCPWFLFSRLLLLYILLRKYLIKERLVL